MAQYGDTYGREHDMALPTLLSRMNQQTALYGGWISIPDALVTETIARIGFDYICLDLQHGLMDYQIAVQLLQLIGLGQSVPIVRPPLNDTTWIGKLLDAGAMGLIIPMINSVQDAQAAVDATRYAPKGTRSWGPVRPLMHTTPQAYLQSGQFEIAIIPMIETVSALNDVEKIVQVEGVAGVYVGPSDLHLALGLEPSYDSDHPQFIEAIDHVLAACQKSGVVAGIHGTAALAPKRFAQGFRMINVASDLSILKNGMAHSLRIAQGQA